MKKIFTVFIFLTLSVLAENAVKEKEQPLLGQPDGHEPYHKEEGLVGKHLVGDKDGDVEQTIIDHGGLEAKDLLGRKDGHDSPQIIDHGGLSSDQDGEEKQAEKPQLILGKPDGHDGGAFADISSEDSLFKQHELVGRGGEERKDAKNYLFYDYEGDEEDDEEEEEEDDDNEQLVRCKRPICNTSLSCPFGPKTDSRGCGICECLKDPCEGQSCEVGYACDMLECPQSKRCDILGFKCIRKTCNGPQPMCANRCEYGYALNKDGCDTCECRLPPGDLQKIDNGGVEVDDDDDDAEDGGDDDDGVKMDDGHEGVRIDNDYEELDKMIPDPDASACGSSCTSAQFCDTVQKDCKRRTRCWLEQHDKHLISHSPLSTRNPAQQQTCDPSFWTYKPLQCHQSMNAIFCWCVDQLGRMNNASLVKVVAKEQEPICKERLMESVTFLLKFSVVAKGSGKERLHELIVDKVASISTARKIDIELFMAPVKHERLTCHVTLKYSKMYDLGYAAEALRLHSGMRLNGEDLEVRQTSGAQVSEVKEYVQQDGREGAPVKNIHLPWKDVFEETPGFGHLAHTNRSIRIILFITFIAMATAIFVLLILMMYRLYQRRGTIRHHVLPSHIPSSLNPANLIGSSSKKSDKVLLVENEEGGKKWVA